MNRKEIPSLKRVVAMNEPRCHETERRQPAENFRQKELTAIFIADNFAH
jgi:hypothetical protein